MSKMDELYNAMYDYCEENKCWNVRMTAKEWNDSIEGDYGPACFTALVKRGKLERDKGYKATSYDYHIVPTGSIKEAIEKHKQEQEKEYAEYTISHYDEAVARIRARYEEMLKQAEEQLNRDLEWELDKLGKAQAFMEQFD